MVAEQLDNVEDGPCFANPVLVTERLVLRPPHADDIPDIAVLANNLRVASMLARMPHPYGEPEARAFVTAALRRIGDKRPGVVLAVTEADSGAFLGCAGLEPKERGLELGYWIGEPFWNRGFATEAAHALVDLAFRASDVDVLHASCRAINPMSRRVLHKCGFQYAGQGLLDSIAAGRVATEVYRLDRRTWLGLRQWARL